MYSFNLCAINLQKLQKHLDIWISKKHGFYNKIAPFVIHKYKRTIPFHCNFSWRILIHKCISYFWPKVIIIILTRQTPRHTYIFLVHTWKKCGSILYASVPLLCTHAELFSSWYDTVLSLIVNTINFLWYNIIMISYAF